MLFFFKYRVYNLSYEDDCRDSNFQIVTPSLIIDRRKKINNEKKTT